MDTITVKYWGGMGNVLFQIAAAVAYSNKFNRPFVLSKYAAFPNLVNYTATSIGLDETEYAESLTEFKEDELKTGVEFPENRNVLLFGFFQDYNIFHAYKDQIFHILGIRTIRDSVLSITGLPIFKRNGLFIHANDTITISLHIRRGDYEDLACYFLLLNEYYYKLALLNIGNRLPGKRIKVLCFYEKKSTASCRKVIDALTSDPELNRYPFEYHHFNEILESGSSVLQEQEVPLKVTDIEEMAIMSQCDHHIIANSTFSWWSAYINPDPEKIVCYPNEYFNHQLYYLVNDGLKVKEWTAIEAWNPWEHRCDCR